MERWKEESEESKQKNDLANHNASHSGAIFSHDDDMHADDEDDDKHLDGSPKGVNAHDKKKTDSVKDSSPKKFVKKGKNG